MGNVSLSALRVNLIVISGRWGSSVVFVKLITESMHSFAFAASRGFTARSALLVWLALRRRTPPVKPAPGTDHEKSAFCRWINDRSGDPFRNRDLNDPSSWVARLGHAVGAAAQRC